MKKVLLASAAMIALAAGPVCAADIRAKPIYKAAPVTAPLPYNWTGFYIGGHIGGGWSGDWNGTTNPLPSPAAFGALALDFSGNGSGVIAGGQIGYNWQFAPNWVAGIEADISWTHLDAATTRPALDLTGANIGSAFMQRDLRWFGTARGRAGYAQDRWLAYVTGGFAYGRINYSGNHATACCAFPVSFTDTKTGWTIGGGLEYALASGWGNWTVRGEYLYINLGSAGATVPQVPPDPRFALRYDWNDTNLHVARFALNYKFDWGKGPVAARY